MHLVMFDIDGTLIKSYDFDTECFQAAVFEVLGVVVGPDWGRYQHVTDAGILSEIIEELDLKDRREPIFAEVKRQFLFRIKEYISCHQVVEIAGASNFLSHLISRKDVSVAFATGAWSESARMKLHGAGLVFPDIPFASSCDHHRRIEVMRIAEKLSGYKHYQSRTYFGDGVWDQQASAALGFNFVSVGTRITSPKSILDYVDVKTAMRYIGL